ncbi:MAG: hypothetical protein KIT80_19375 [Chitinophagaceae bacterium]|nr:hypothetical protein [Chitinophagaceae bacterium]MCW5929090.1 hypothetical protein [Chitinophagaceae bacterium]
MKKTAKTTARFILLLLLAAAANTATAQNILNKKVSFSVQQQRLDDVLTILGNKGNFSFSYNSNILKRDSLVTYTANNHTVSQVLNQLLNEGFEFKESGNYIIIRKTALRVTSIVQQSQSEGDIFTITGYVVNSETGEKLGDVSIYEPKNLVSTLTDEQGRFSIRLKNRRQPTSLAVSRSLFEDTTVVINPRYNMQLEIAIVPAFEKPVISTANIYQRAGAYPIEQKDSILVSPVTKPETIEYNRFARFLLSAKLKTQSLNIKDILGAKAVQVSLVPGFGIHGKMGSQVINNFSLNVLGGYTGGVDGAEIGGVFNINKNNVRMAQIAGVVNLVGGGSSGIQIAGVHNTVLKHVHGIQLGGISNHVSHNMRGIQVGGIGNLVKDSLEGIQIAGINNHVQKNSRGIQVAGIANITAGDADGLQAAGIFNYAKRLKGVQIGLVNIADTVDGYTIGLVNIVRKGYHKLYVHNSEITHFNLAFKTGNARLYSVLRGGLNFNNDQKLYSLGYGIGTNLSLGSRFSCMPEISADYLYTGNWEHSNILNRISLQFDYKISGNLSVTAGPSFALYYSNQEHTIAGYANPSAGAHKYNWFGSNKVTTWFGWNAGLTLF